MAGQVFSGARAMFRIDQEQIGYAGGVTGAESIDYEPVDVLDNLAVKEFVPVAYRVTLSAQIFRVVGSPLKSFKTGPNAAGTAKKIFPKLAEILDTGDMTCTLTDKTGVVAAQFNYVKCQEHTFDVTSRGIVSENVNFVAISMQDESEIVSVAAATP